MLWYTAERTSFTFYAQIRQHTYCRNVEHVLRTFNNCSLSVCGGIVYALLCKHMKGAIIYYTKQKKKLYTF